jgi:dihydrofolate reductase
VSHVIVIQFVTLDGAVRDPDGEDGTPGGGWAFRDGPAAVAGDKFRLGEIMDTGTLLLGRRTWEKFTGIWPARDDAFSTRMNRMRKLVATRSGVDAGAWSNSAVLEGDLAEAVTAATGDVVVAGSLEVVHALIERDLVDEYRLLVFPTVLGGGERLFREGSPPAQLRLTGAEVSGPAALLRYERM